MQLRRVVVTGMGAVSPFGRGTGILISSLLEGKSGIAAVPALASIGGLRTRVAGLVTGVEPGEIERKHRRSMSPMSIFAVLACRDACRQGGVSEGMLGGGRLGVAVGSTVGSTQASQEFFRDFFRDMSLERMKSGLFFRIMNHSCASNVSQALGITGRVVAPSAACSTGCQAVGFGYEMIATGKQDLMICGGADEFHPLTAATFDIMNAASIRYNDRPAMTPRPFDRDRDGVVCSEGAGILLLEALDSARRRGAEILAEIAGFATTSDPSSIANPNADQIEACMRLALDDAGLSPGQVDYINAHATATVQGDIAECRAIGRLFGGDVPVSSFKGHLGHAMAASGSLELAAAIAMMGRDRLIPTLNLDNIDGSCDTIKHVTRVEAGRISCLLKNNFALGGVNSSIVVKRYRT